MSESESTTSPKDLLDEVLLQQLRASKQTLQVVMYDRDALLEEVKGLRAIVGPKSKHPHHEWAADLARKAADAFVASRKGDAT